MGGDDDLVEQWSILIGSMVVVASAMNAVELLPEQKFSNFISVVTFHKTN